MKVKQGGERNLFIFEDKPINNHIKEKVSSRAPLDMVIHGGIFKNNKIIRFSPVLLSLRQGQVFTCSACSPWLDRYFHHDDQ